MWLWTSDLLSPCLSFLIYKTTLLYSMRAKTDPRTFLILLLSRFSRVQLFATLWTAALQAPLSMGILQARILEWVAMPSYWGFSQPGMEPRSPTLQADSILTELPGKPKNTEVGSLSHLQGKFLTQELDWGLLHCSHTLYQLSYPALLSPSPPAFNFSQHQGLFQ